MSVLIFQANDVRVTLTDGPRPVLRVVRLGREPKYFHADDALVDGAPGATRIPTAGELVRVWSMEPHRRPSELRQAHRFLNRTGRRVVVVGRD